MSVATESIEIKAKPKACYDVITDFESYPKFLSDVTNTVIDKKSKNQFVVTYTLDLIKKISYTLKLTGNPHKSLKWDFIKGDVMKSNSGKWVIEEVKPNLTKCTYSIEINLGLFVPGAIARRLVGTSLPSMLRSFKKRIEGRKN